MFNFRVLDRSLDDIGVFAKYDAVVKLKAYELPFRKELFDYVSGPDFVPLVWVKKDDGDEGGDGNGDGVELSYWIPLRLGWVLQRPLCRRFN
jgi:hypothetical protein